jgi:nitrogen-specific signal transduction histidine kinase
MDSNRQLAEALEKLEASQDYSIQRERLHAVGSMASGIAHDFNNALAPILGYTELLLRPGALNDREKAESYLKIIHTAATDSSSIIARLREFYRSKQERDTMAPVSLDKLIPQVIALTEPKWRHQTQARGGEIEIRTELRPIPEFSGDEAALREMLANLIFNAVDAIQKKGKITLRTHVRNDFAVIHVTDTGAGMSEKVRARCFEPFFSTKAEHGTGLGLSMVYGVVQRHGGFVEIQSKPGTGTDVIISIPLIKHYKTMESPAATPPSVKSLRILVVEDDPLVREVISAQLTEIGHKPEGAGDGLEGFEKFKQSAFDLVITDRAMPGMNGDQLAIAIKEIKPDMPVMLLTGFGDMIDETNSPGVDIVVGKPFTFTVLRDSIARIMS